MNGKDNIINKILADANDRCAQIVNDARQQATEIVNKANQCAQVDSQKTQTRLDDYAKERLRTALANAKLDGKKYRLLTKQQLIERCYATALQRLANLQGKDRQDFLRKVIAKYAESGETVLCCKQDNAVVTQKFLDGFNLNLVLGKQNVEAQGGVVLVGNGYEKDLTLPSLVSYARQQTEAQVANILFSGETNE